MTTPSEEPVWMRRAVERSTRVAKQRAEQRLERFLDAAQAVIADKGTTDFTVQEVVDRSHQSLRSFYQHFDGKHELLLALFEDALRRTADQIRAATAGQTDRLDRLKVAVQLLFELCRPDPTAQRPLFTDFAPRLRTSHPTEVRVAHGPLLALFARLVKEAGAAGRLRTTADPERVAMLIVQTVMFVAQSSGTPEESAAPITADEIWDFCAHGLAAD